MKLHKIYIIIQCKDNRILHTTSDKAESMKKFNELQKAHQKVIAQCIYQ